LSEISKRFFEVKKDQISDELGIVVGWAITCTKDGQPYYDLNVDREGAYKGQRIPEHIDHPEMFKAAADFAEATDAPGNVMHAGPDVGKFLFLFPFDNDIYKALFGVEHDAPITGLAVGYKPPPDVLAKFKSGELRGFSIEGWHDNSELIEDA
jgi:hypothetical protein